MHWHGAHETPIGVQTPDKRGATHRAYFWQFSSPGKGVVFDFELTRSKKVAQRFFRDYGGILHTDGRRSGNYMVEEKRGRQVGYRACFAA